jgi:hypothetical protein
MYLLVLPSMLLALLHGGVCDGNACGVQELQVVGCIGGVMKLGDFGVNRWL